MVDRDRFEARIHQAPYFLAPINTGFAVGGSPTSQLVDFHRARASREIAIAYVGNVAVSSQYTTNNGTLYPQESPNAPWLGLVSAIEERGSIPAAQLACRIGERAAIRAWGVRDPARALERAQKELLSIDAAELVRAVEHFATAARFAEACGFQVLQIHAAHGYLISSALNEVVNKRSDEYGDRYRLLRDVVQAVRASTNDVVLDVRLSLTDFVSDDDEIDLRAVSEVVALGIELVSWSSGSYEMSRELIYPSRRSGRNVYLDQASRCAGEFSDLFWNVAGNIRALPPADDLPKNLTFSIGRPLIADPDFVSKALAGNGEEVARCSWSGHCHYYTRGRPHIECPKSEDLNPDRFQN